MAEPVKLSRERWEMLAATSELAGTPVDAKYPLRSMILKRPREIDGVIFLPAEYVPAETDRGVNLWATDQSFFDDMYAALRVRA